jgi:sulfoxide reductase catalytic subunit YedY
VAKIRASEITPERVFLSRRQFLAGAGVLAAGALASACGIGSPTPSPSSRGPQPTGGTDELNDSWTSYDSATSYNNFYEFSLSKEGVSQAAKGFRTEQWTLQVGGLVNRPGTYGVDDLTKAFSPEERIYRLRCVEAWSMVIPWMGFSLSKLLAKAEPLSNAKYVRFETLLDPERMPGQKGGMFKWPYAEGLRMDEAMHDLTILSIGLYGKPSLPQNGAPIRLVVPWKYGFKSIKSVVKIDLVEEIPVSFWMASAPQEYGFYANVNPEVSHPRWSQATERRIGESGRRKSLPFNGYGDQVGQLYSDMDLRKNF